MLNALLDIVQRDDGSYYFSGGFWDRLGEGLIYALIGFLIVFAGIVIIITVIWLIGLLMRKTNNLAFLTNIGKKKKAQPEPAVEPQAVAASSEDEIPDEVKAAIVAAIMAYYESAQPKCEFKVKRIKRI